MSRLSTIASVLVTLALVIPTRAAEPQKIDLKRGVPAEAYLAIYNQHNPERDFQRAYLEDVWATVEETQLVERALKIVTARIPADDLDKAKTFLEELKVAVAPMDFQALWDCQEVAYAQTMDNLTSQHLLLLRLSPETAAAYEKGVINLFQVAKRHADGDVSVHVNTDSPTHLTSLVLPDKVPFRPTVASHGDIFVLSSSADFAERSLAAMLSSQGDSKFDDPRLQEALAELPTPEDTILFYDGRQHFKLFHELIEAVAAKAGDHAEAERWLGIAAKIFDELRVLDYEITVEYTEENLNRSATMGKLIPGTEDRLLAKMFGSGQSFEQWDRWVPAEATSYSLNTGVNLHALYEFVFNLVHDQIPEAHGAIARFEQWQDEHDLHIDRDILQAFSGECVNVSLPAEVPALLSNSDHVWALRCHQPEQIRALLHRLVDHLNQFTLVKMQGLSLTEAAVLEGFEHVNATIFALFGAEPVVGFHDGWMICGSNLKAVQKVLDTRAGKTPSIVTTDDFQKFHLTVDGPVEAISHTNLALTTRKIASLMRQAGAILPIVIGVVGADVDEEQLRPWQEIVGLLPSLGKIVGKFDFLEAHLSITQVGTESGTYLRHGVTYVRPPPETVIAEPFE